MTPKSPQGIRVLEEIKPRCRLTHILTFLLTSDRQTPAVHGRSQSSAWRRLLLVEGCATLWMLGPTGRLMGAKDVVPLPASKPTRNIFIHTRVERII